MPKDAAAILSLAAKVNGLGAPGLQPWHLKASYKTYDDSGKPSGDGTYEMFWAGSRQYKQVFTSAAFTQTEYGTADGVYRTGDARSVPYPQEYLVEQILHPMPSQAEIDAAMPIAAKKEFGKAKLECVTLSQKIARLPDPPFGLFPLYCLVLDKPILRFSSYGNNITSLFNQLVLFQGRAFAKQVDISDNNKPAVSIMVDELGGLGAIDPHFFEPAAGSVNTNDLLAEVDPDVMEKQVVSRPEPPYPEKARRAGIDGTVVLDAVIGRDGRVRSLKVLQSPDPDLTVASLFTVRGWRYRPYLVHNEPTEVHTSIRIMFHLH